MPQQIQGAQSLHGPGLHPSQPNSGLLGALDECYGNDTYCEVPVIENLVELVQSRCQKLLVQNCACNKNVCEQT